MDGVQVKQELLEHLKFLEPKQRPEPPKSVSVIDLSSSDSDSDDSSSSSDNVLGINGKRPRVCSGSSGDALRKKKTMEELGVALPVGFLDPLPPKNAPLPLPPSAPPGFQSPSVENARTNVDSCKQFWKAGDYEGAPFVHWDASSGGLDHVRVHPKFLHSNATSHKWVLGAFAELLDNSLDEVCNGATFVNIDMLKNKKDGSRMLVIEDNGGGMDPDKMRRCMSLGYSAKSKIADTIGQYGNGFKTSTMRLGADVIVFSRCFGEVGKRPTQSIGLLSYTFLRSTGKEDIVVPMLDYERGRSKCNRMIRSSTSDWDRNLETIVQWSPFSSEADLLEQFNRMEDHGTRIIMYNLWEDDHGQLELDFDADPYDVQIRGVNRDDKSIQMAKQFPNSKHFLTYRHSLRSYASILYLRIPHRFRIILRGKDVEHHNVVNDMMMTQEITYRPQTVTNRVLGDSHMVATVTIGFVKDAKAHIDVQGFNVYHKNRLIKPFWRVWNAAGSDGRGVIGVLEANFVEPAHDKQGFERTIVLSRLETKLVQMQKTYWSTYCHKIGYAPRRNKHIVEQEPSTDYLPRTPSQSKKKSGGSSSKAPSSVSDKVHSLSNHMPGRRGSERLIKAAEMSQIHRDVYIEGESVTKTPTKSGKVFMSPEQASSSDEDCSCYEMQTLPKRQEYVVNGNEVSRSNSNSDALNQLQEENRQLRERLERQEQEILGGLLLDLQNERDRQKSLELQLEEATRKIEELNREEERLIVTLSEERVRRDTEEENLRKKLKNATKTIQELLDKVVLLEKMKSIQKQNASTHL